MKKEQYPAKAFFSQKMDVDEIEKSNKHREKFAELAELLQQDLPMNAYLVEAVDLLENAAMYATKAFSHKDYKSEL